MPQHKRGPWSQTEDQYLLHLANLHGAHNWVRISSTIGTRSPKQCRERFHQNLKPNLNHDPITPEEGILIEQMVAEMGKRWAEIARRLRGRSDNAVKNWWNGGMNRRRRSHNHRRRELEVHQSAPSIGPIGSLPSTYPHVLPHFAQPPPVPQQYYGQPIYHHSHSHVPHHIHLPQNGLHFRQPGLIETPLPSPSAFSQLSADGAPSLVSDCSSVSTRSPHNGASPIELPPLSGTPNEHRRSAASMLRLGHPGSFASDCDFQVPTVPGTRAGQARKQPPQLLQEGFLPSQPQTFAQPGEFYGFQQSRQPSPIQQNQLPQAFLLPACPPQRVQAFPQQSQLGSWPTSSVQLPSITDLAPAFVDTRTKAPGIAIDPALMPSLSASEGSLKNKMSLSNITH